MKTSSVEFISRSPNPLPMKSKHHRFVLLRRIFQPWQWKRRKKRNRFEQTSRTLQRKISMRSTKDQLVEKMFLCRFSSGLHGNTAADSVRSGWPLWHAAKKQRSLRAQAHLSKSRTETVKTETLEKKLLDIRAKEQREKGERESSKGKKTLSSDTSKEQIGPNKSALVFTHSNKWRKRSHEIFSALWQRHSRSWKCHKAFSRTTAKCRCLDGGHHRYPHTQSSTMPTITKWLLLEKIRSP
ncbi:phosphatase and actin regulator 2 [Trichonephila clavipes]|nr:phosphatase and actin regulator 2 [Trichonephila clavipes]